MRKNISLHIVLLFTLTIWLPLQAIAISYSPFGEQRENKESEGIREKGEIVCLFYSGSEAVKNMINVDDILIVYREGPKYELREVAKVKVLSYRRQDYIKGVVLDGELKTGDIAMKGEVASLVISSIEKCE